MAHDDTVPRLDRSVVSVGRLDEQADDLAYWLAKTPTERFEAIEINRRVAFGNDSTTARLHRVLEVARLGES